MYAIGNNKILKIICNSYLWDILWLVTSAGQSCWGVRSMAGSYFSDWWLLAINICSSSLSCCFCRLGVGGYEAFMSCPGSRVFQQVVFQGAKKQSWKGSIALCGISPSCVYKTWWGKKSQADISVKAEGSKGMWAGVQGCFGGAKLSVCKTEMFVAHSWGLQFPLPSAGEALKMPKKFCRYKSAPTHMCV